MQRSLNARGPFSTISRARARNDDEGRKGRRDDRVRFLFDGSVVYLVFVAQHEEKNRIDEFDET